MDAEVILLPKICDGRSHFRGSIGHAILSVDRLKTGLGQDPVTNAWKRHIGSQQVPLQLPAAFGMSAAAETPIAPKAGGGI